MLLDFPVTDEPLDVLIIKTNLHSTISAIVFLVLTGSAGWYYLYPVGEQLICGLADEALRAEHQARSSQTQAMVMPPEYHLTDTPYLVASLEYRRYENGARAGWFAGIAGYSLETSFAPPEPIYRDGYQRGIGEGKRYLAKMQVQVEETERRAKWLTTIKNVLVRQ